MGGRARSRARAHARTGCSHPLLPFPLPPLCPARRAVSPRARARLFSPSPSAVEVLWGYDQEVAMGARAGAALVADIRAAGYACCPGGGRAGAAGGEGAVGGVGSVGEGEGEVEGAALAGEGAGVADIE
jgi:hypothetical protein